jgi:hypothetical protein
LELWCRKVQEMHSKCQKFKVLGSRAIGVE